MEIGVFMSKDNKSAINKELSLRMKQFKEALSDQEKRIELENNIIGSEVLIRFEIFLPSTTQKFSDGVFIYMNDLGEIVDAEYYVRDADDITIIGLESDDFSVVKELFKDSFSLEIE